MRGTLIIGPVSRVAAFPMAAPANATQYATARVAALQQLFAAVPKHSPRLDCQWCAARATIANSGFMEIQFYHVLDCLSMSLFFINLSNS
jgi:hypothetical protein